MGLRFWGGALRAENLSHRKKSIAARLTGMGLNKRGGKASMNAAKKVLVVDDEKGIRFLLSEVLLSQGFEVSLARDGQESLDQLEKDCFDLVITDINMPRLDGLAMLKRMKRTGRSEKVIIMTGDPSDQRLSDPAISDVVIRLFKPFGMENFLSVVLSATGNEVHRVGGKQTREVIAQG
jgi:two-component system, response regulator, stage 0 sporulation protein F